MLHRSVAATGSIGENEDERKQREYRAFSPVGRKSEVVVGEGYRMRVVEMNGLESATLHFPIRQLFRALTRSRAKHRGWRRNY